MGLQLNENSAIDGERKTGSFGIVSALFMNKSNDF